METQNSRTLEEVRIIEDKSELINWLRYEAGSSNPDYFHAETKGGWKLQQVPEEYAELLLFFRNSKISFYLELGLGNGGSFALNTLYLSEKLKYAVGVDNLSYGYMIGQNEFEIQSYINKINLKTAQINFKKLSTDQYFERIKTSIISFDAIFIDADHSYNGVKKDYINALRFLNKGGYLIFHDINSKACPGVVRVWNEIKSKPYKNIWEFIHSDTCGIGVVKL